MSFARNELLTLAQSAGKKTLEYYRKESRPRLKSDRSPVTDADMASNEVILNGLEQLDAKTPVISEESQVPDYEERKKWTRFWLVDPLDGTKEFLKANGEFTINIALIEDGIPQCAVIVAPVLNLSYFAQREKGSFKLVDGAAVPIFKNATKAENKIVVESRSHPSPALEAYLATISVAKRIKVGSSLKFAYVAEGIADLYPRFSPCMEWDVAAGDAIYRYATRSKEANPSPLAYNKESLKVESFVLGD